MSEKFRQKLTKFIKNPFCYYSLLLLCTIPLVIKKIAANDLWKSLYFGRYLAHTLSFPVHSEFTFSPVRPTVWTDAFTWFGNLLFYGVYEIGGFYALQSWRVFCVLFCLIIIHSLSQYELSLRSLLLLIGMVLALSQKILLRNALVLIVFLPLLYWVWFHAKFNARDSLVFALIPFFALWSNIHGSYLIGVVLLAVLIIGDLIDWLRRKSSTDGKQLVRFIGLFLMVLLTVIYIKPTPDHSVISIPKSAVSQFVTLGSQVIDQTDKPAVNWSDELRLSDFLSVPKRVARGSNYEPTDPVLGGLQSPLKLLYVPTVLASVILALTALIFFITRPQFRVAPLLIILVSCMIGFAYFRTIAVIPLTTVPFIFMYLKSPRESLVRTNILVHWCTVVLFIVIFTTIIGYTATGSIDSLLYLRDHEFGFGLHQKFSTRIPDLVKKRCADVPVYNHYDIGGYLIWKWWPEKDVFIDSKILAYDPSFKWEYFRSAPHQLMNKYDLELALFPYYSAWNYYYFIPHPKWTLKYYDEGMLLFSKRSSKTDCLPAGDGQFLLSDSQFQVLSKEKRETVEKIQSFLDTYGNTKSEIGHHMHPFQTSDRNLF